MAKSKTTTVYVLHHTNSGTPESGQIHSIHSTEAGALNTMKIVLDEDYDGVTMEDNENEDFDYMYISEQTLLH